MNAPKPTVPAMTDIFAAVESGAIEEIGHLLDTDAQQANARREADLLTPLHLCCDHPKIAATLLEHGAEANAIDSDERQVMPLHQAAAMGNIETTRLLLKHGADVNYHSFAGPPLHCVFGSLLEHLPEAWTDVAELLLAHGAEINATINPDSDCWTALHQACNEGYADAVDFLLAHGANPLLSKDGITPLFIATGNDFEDIVQLFQARGIRS